jgi:hypothetical protein
MGAPGGASVYTLWRHRSTFISLCHGRALLLPAKSPPKAMVKVHPQINLFGVTA